jgi:hypothetical protein
MPMWFNVFPTFSWITFTDSDLTLRSLTHFELMLVQGDRDLVSVFYRWKSCFPWTICWRYCLFSSLYFAHLCWKSDGYSCLGLCQGLLFHRSSGLFFCHYHASFITIALWYCLQTGIVLPPALLFWISIALAIQGLLCFQMNFKIGIFLSLWGISLWFDKDCIDHIDWCQDWRYFSQYWLCQSMNMRCPSIFWCLHSWLVFTL